MAEITTTDNEFSVLKNEGDAPTASQNKASANQEKSSKEEARAKQAAEIFTKVEALNKKYGLTAFDPSRLSDAELAEIMGVKESLGDPEKDVAARKKDVEKNLRKLALEHHPDRNPGEEQRSTEVMQLLSPAAAELQERLDGTKRQVVPLVFTPQPNQTQPNQNIPVWQVPPQQTAPQPVQVSYQTVSQPVQNPVITSTVVTQQIPQNHEGRNQDPLGQLIDFAYGIKVGTKLSKKIDNIADNAPFPLDWLLRLFSTAVKIAEFFVDTRSYKSEELSKDDSIEKEEEVSVKRESPKRAKIPNQKEAEEKVVEVTNARLAIKDLPPEDKSAKKTESKEEETARIFAELPSSDVYSDSEVSSAIAEAKSAVTKASSSVDSGASLVAENQVAERPQSSKGGGGSRG